MIEAPFSPEERDNLLSDLLRVGPEKPLGYLPLATIERCGPLGQTIRATLESKGLHVQVFEPDACFVGSGAMFVADLTALQQLLDEDEGSKTLHDSGWTPKARAFIYAVATVHVDMHRNFDLYRLIGLAFADPFFKDYLR